MSSAAILEAIRLLNVSISLAQRLGINLAKYNAMRELSEDGELTQEQIDQLASEARQAVNDL